MSEWWKSANPGGPMVGPPMIRPLYPPDAAERGKRPSDPGDDVLAIKRAVSRSGHWPWKAFDEVYSDSFAHGRSGNVSENGLAGLQRQNHVDATGWMGEHTYNLIRSARIPTGLPHAGEPLLDATACRLLEDYREAQAGGSTFRELALDKARSMLGYQESPAGTNANMFGAWYGMNYEPWCAMFVTWCQVMVGAPTGAFMRAVSYAYVPYLVSDARAGRFGLRVTDDPLPGDVVCYDWHSADGTFDHVGFFEDGDADDFDAIEGNTSTSNDSNGGEVMRRSRRSSDANLVFIRVAE